LGIRFASFFGATLDVSVIQQKNTRKIVHQFLDYAATHPDAVIPYSASSMVLVGHCNASYLSETNTRSRAGGHFFISNGDAIPSNKGAILTILQIIKAVMSSAAEAETGALYINCRFREAIPSRHTLEYLVGHKQPPHQCKQTTLQHLEW
jgi:hypothetical protein